MEKIPLFYKNVICLQIGRSIIHVYKKVPFSIKNILNCFKINENFIEYAYLNSKDIYKNDTNKIKIQQMSNSISINNEENSNIINDSDNSLNKSSTVKSGKLIKSFLKKSNSNNNKNRNFLKLPTIRESKEVYNVYNSLNYKISFSDNLNLQVFPYKKILNNENVKDNDIEINYNDDSKFLTKTNIYLKKENENKSFLYKSKSEINSVEVIDFNSINDKGDIEDNDIDNSISNNQLFIEKIKKDFSQEIHEDFKEKEKEIIESNKNLNEIIITNLNFNNDSEKNITENIQNEIK